MSSTTTASVDVLEAAQGNANAQITKSILGDCSNQCDIERALASYSTVTLQPSVFSQLGNHLTSHHCLCLLLRLHLRPHIHVNLIIA